MALAQTGQNGIPGYVNQPMYAYSGAAPRAPAPQNALRSAPQKPTALRSAPAQPGAGTVNYKPGGNSLQMQTAPASGAAMAPSVTAPNAQPQIPGYSDPSQIQTPQGWDFTAPGVGEQYFNYALDQSQNRAPTSNNAQGAYQNFLNTSPADMNPYYDAARRRFTQGTNTQLAARGVYGSSVGEDQLMEGLGNLNAQQAKDEADYGLSRNQLGGSLASSSDRSSLAGSQNDLSYMSALGGMANSAQDQRRQRGQDYFNNTMALTGAATGYANGGYNNLLQDDQSLFGNQENLYTGQGTVAQQQGANTTNQTRQDYSQALAMAMMLL